MLPKTIAFHHFGCKVNFAEASALSRQFREKGFLIGDFHEKADVYVISTCVVTAVAEKKCRAAIRQAHRLNPDAKIAVIGCFPELKHDEVAQMEGVSLVLGHSDKFMLPEYLGAGVPDTHPSGPLPASREGKTDSERFVSSWSSGDRTRSFLKIQDGCDYYCAYCAIPFARGNSRSDTIANVLGNAAGIARSGIREIILTGVNIGDFGRETKESLTGLLRELEKQSNVPRIRLSSIEPDLLTDEIIDIMAHSAKFMPHFHIPLQSGSDRVLRAMKRKYDTGLYRSRIEKIRSVIPDACIAADVIAGFPGETDDDFRDTVSTLDHLELSYMHVFSYSKRENTLASRIEPPVSDRVKKERSEILHRMSEEKKRRFYDSAMGSTRQVLFESDNSDGYMHGFTENYIKVKTKFDPALVNEIQEVTLKAMDRDGLYHV
jgi:threonylcarbamoyladenosine tRNA methylthiotransferase MtaB